MKPPIVLGSMIAGLILLTCVPPVSVESGGVGLLPPQVTLNLQAGDLGSYQLKIHNGNGQQVIVSLSVVVAQVPDGGSPSHISLGFPLTVVAGSGNTPVTVSMMVSPSAVPGTYILINTLTS